MLGERVSVCVRCARACVNWCSFDDRNAGLPPLASLAGATCLILGDHLFSFAYFRAAKTLSASGRNDAKALRAVSEWLPLKATSVLLTKSIFVKAEADTPEADPFTDRVQSGQDLDINSRVPDCRVESTAPLSRVAAQ